ncbi:hypothetical protein SteCoe_21413 [Stentor coeruleus]|uniref:Uncharacterized protein n=1 Tax=Stentor coeruleus TaxID=5963 RepID=A0A1R2BPJ7_9CILI|nr:hypothetical protein SteCoe_21413 [Stentor coeruleus]
MMYFWYFLYLLSITRAVDLINDLNEKYKIVSGTEEQLFTEINKVYEGIKNPSGVLFEVILWNNTLTERLEMHYIEKSTGNSSVITAHFVPKYIPNNFYDLKGFMSILNKEFHIKGKQVAVYYENEQFLQVNENYTCKLEFKLCEAVILVDKILYKLHVLLAYEKAYFYLWSIGTGNMSIHSFLRFEVVYGFGLGAAVCVFMIYWYYSNKQKFPCMTPSDSLILQVG